MSTQACPECRRPHVVSGRPRGERISCPCGAGFLVGADPFSAADTAVARPGVGARAAREPEEARATTPGTPPPEVPGFELLELLGRGGMGEVWKARQLSLGRTVAVKVLPSRLATDAEFVTRFDKEATALASLSHPNIVQIIDRGRAGEHYFFAMELVEGRSLREVLEDGLPPLAEALRLVLQVARAVECAHERGIIHRDLKPENVLVDGRGHAKVADFGLAGIRDSETRLQLTATRVAMGTINYMAPEQRRDARSVDGRADLYSLGVVLYELLTGELPIGRFALPSQRVKGLDAATDDVVARLLENAPDDRYPTASMLCADLETLLARLSTSPGGLQARLHAETSRPGSSTGQAAQVPTERPSRRRQALRGVRAALAGVGALVVAGYLVRTFGEVAVSVQRPAQASPVSAPAGAALHPPNTNGDLFVLHQEKKGRDGLPTLTLDFRAADAASGENLNAHVGHWRLEEGRLRSTQVGNETGGTKLRPRAYVAKRYYSADEFSAETELTLAPVPAPYVVEPGAQRFGELSFRRVGVQVSVYALPGEGMRLLWRYRLKDGTEVSGSSGADVAQLLEDEFPVPEGPFKVRLTLRRLKGGVEAVGRVNGRRFASKLLPGLEGAVGKLALGCRNMDCSFQGLSVHAREVPRPERVRVSDSGD